MRLQQKNMHPPSKADHLNPSSCFLKCYIHYSNAGWLHCSQHNSFHASGARYPLLRVYHVYVAKRSCRWSTVHAHFSFAKTTECKPCKLSYSWCMQPLLQHRNMQHCSKSLLSFAKFFGHSFIYIALICTLFSTCSMRPWKLITNLIVCHSQARYFNVIHCAVWKTAS